MPTAIRYTPEVIETLKGKLPDKYTDLLAAIGSGKSYAEIASEFSLKPGTVRSRLNRAREAAARVLNGAPAQ